MEHINNKYRNYKSNNLILIIIFTPLFVPICIPKLKTQIRERITQNSENDIIAIQGNIELIKDNIELNEVNEQKINQDEIKHARLYED